MRWQRLAGCARQGAKMTQFVMWVIWLFMLVAAIVWAAVFLLVIRIFGEIIWRKFRP
jgi:riboflavin transporter FmnP